ADCALAEADETNNSRAVTFTVGAGSTDLSWKPMTATVSGTTVTLATELCNGAKATRPFVVSLWVSRSTPATCGSSGADASAVLEVPASTCLPISVALPDRPSGSHTARLLADARCQVPESSETNNEATASYTIP
ncbi:MAG: hypothetical protein D6731_05115, partial [Planctomycetota bacterium]